MDDEDRALELWRRWFEFSSDPYVMDMDAIEWCYVDRLCFFCRREWHKGHVDDCVYVEAAKLLGQPVKTSVEATCK